MHDFKVGDEVYGYRLGSVFGKYRIVRATNCYWYLHDDTRVRKSDGYCSTPQRSKNRYPLWKIGPITPEATLEYERLVTERNRARHTRRTTDSLYVALGNAEKLLRNNKLTDQQIETILKSIQNTLYSEPSNEQ